MELVAHRVALTDVTVKIKKGDDLALLLDFLMEEFDGIDATTGLLVSSMSVEGWDSLMLTLEIKQCE